MDDNLVSEGKAPNAGRVFFTRRLTIWLGGIGLWCLIVLFNVSQNLASYAYQNQTGVTINWPQVLLLSITPWILWVLFAPGIIKLARRFSFDRKKLGKRLFTLLLIGVLISYSVFFLEMILIAVISVNILASSPSVPGLEQLIFYKIGMNFLIYSLIVGSYNASTYYQRFQQQQKEAAQLQLKTVELRDQLSRAELESLKMQLHPHFLFNTHHSILALMLKNENENAIKMLTQLSDFLRSTLDHTGKLVVPLKKELELLEIYLNIQKVRFQDRLHVQMNISPETLMVNVPNFLLQPIVENSIKHGLDKMSSPGIIEIAAARNENWLILDVKDNGPGLENHSRIQNSDGLGIKNTKARLEQMYYDNFSFELLESQYKGLHVKIRIPVQTSENIVTLGK